MVRLNGDELAGLERVSRTLGVSKANAIREAIMRMMSEKTVKALVLAVALLGVGCADAMPGDEMTNGAGGVGGAVAAAGTGGANGVGGGAAYVMDPAPTCTGERVAADIQCAYPGLSANESGSFCSLCGLDYVPDGGCAIRNTQTGQTFGRRRDVFCVSSISQCGTCTPI